MTAAIREARPDDRARITEIAVDAGLFEPDEVVMFDELLDAFFGGSLEGHTWLVAALDERVAGGAYVAPEPFGDRVWNLYVLAVDPAEHDRGIGRALLGEMEARLLGLGDEQARVLIVETSSTDQYAATRDFYRRGGFDEESTIRDFYGPGDHKVTFWKSFVA